jgi:hypothetical protein
MTIGQELECARVNIEKKAEWVTVEAQFLTVTRRLKTFRKKILSPWLNRLNPN